MTHVRVAMLVLALVACDRGARDDVAAAPVAPAVRAPVVTPRPALPAVDEVVVVDSEDIDEARVADVEVVTDRDSEDFVDAVDKCPDVLDDSADDIDGCPDPG